ncbi:MAG TPA: DUF2304 family protein [bacterium]|nr:DUF2304 family protein [bacterium]
MLQKIVALALIGFFLIKLLWQQRQRRISWLEFGFWLIFWLSSALAVLSLSQIDSLVAKLGFSGSGIDVLLYVGVAVCFYFIFRLRLKLEKYERQLTQLVSLMAKQDPLTDNKEDQID